MLKSDGSSDSIRERVMQRKDKAEDHIPSPRYQHRDECVFRDLELKLAGIDTIIRDFDLLAVPSVKIVGYIGAIKK